MRIRYHGTRPYLGAVHERDADRSAALDQDASHSCAGADVGTVLPGIIGDRLRHGPRAASHEGPLRHLAVDLADVVMQQNVGRSRGVGPAVGSDRARHAAGGLDLGRLEPFLEQLGDRQGHDLHEVAGAFDVQSLHLPDEAGQLE